MPEQLVLPFIPEIDRQAAEARETKAARSKRANAIAILRSAVRQYPMTDYERQVVPKGVRLSRFVIGWECEVCPYATHDHSLDNKFGLDTTNPRDISVLLICLKDYYEKGHAMPKLGDIKKGTEIGYKCPTKRIWAACEVCGKERWVLFRNGQPEYSQCIRCGTKMRSQKLHRENSPSWKGGQFIDRGYVYIYQPEHPEAMANGYIKRARLVLAKKLGRPILPNMRSHHINGIKDDDRPENLQEISQSEHARYHGQNANEKLKCEECGQVFKSAFALGSHKRNKHPVLARSTK